MRRHLTTKVILKVLGSLLIIESFFLTLALAVSLIYGGDDSIAFLISTGISLFAGLALRLFTRHTRTKIRKREGYVIVSSVWIIFSLFGSLPFILHGAIPSFTDAFFETISGFTTTGSSVLNDIESLPHGLLFWRSLIQWLGGMGIIVLSLIILPVLGIGGMQLFAAEAPGPVPDKIHPRVKETAKRLWALYLVFTLAEAVLLFAGGMTIFDALNHALTTMATGGYSTKQASIAHYDSAYIHYVITFFMFIAGTNFTLSYFAVKLKFSKLLRNEEFRYYSGFMLGFTLFISLMLYLSSDLNFEQAFRDSAFQVVSLVTTTGFATADYLTWMPFIPVLLFVLMFFGGSAGSTAGGIKIMRIVVVIKNSIAEFKRLVHPNAIIPVRFNGKTVKSSVVRNILAFVVIYILIFISGTLIMAAHGLDFETALGSVIATLGNIGPGIGEVGPAANFADIPPSGKWFLSFLMLVGRLEVFTVVILLSPAFWKK